MKYAVLAVRSLIGLIFFVLGLNGFLNFIPQPPLSGPAGEFMGALAASGYFFPVLKGTEVIAGILLLANRFTGLALVVLSPIVINIALFHYVLAKDPQGMGMSAFLVLGMIFMGYTYRKQFTGLFESNPSVD